MKIYFLIIVVTFFSIKNAISQNDTLNSKKPDSLDLSIISIEKMIELKKSDKHQYDLLIKSKNIFGKDDLISVEEFPEYYKLIVSHKDENNYYGGKECYKLDKNTGEMHMIWHEHPMKIQEIKETEEK